MLSLTRFSRGCQFRSNTNHYCCVVSTNLSPHFEFSVLFALVLPMYKFVKVVEEFDKSVIFFLAPGFADWQFEIFFFICVFVYRLLCLFKMQRQQISPAQQVTHVLEHVSPLLTIVSQESSKNKVAHTFFSQLSWKHHIAVKHLD